MERHEERVSAIASRVKQFHASNRPFRIYHGSTNSTRQSQHWEDNTVDVSKLSNVLRVDKEEKLAVVEPNVPMDKLVECTLQHGLIPPVVMEFPGITVGGGFSGTSGESSSFKHGLFEQTIVAIEMVLGNGEVVRASSTQNSDLLYGAASSYGTLGVITLLELKLIEARKYVELEYRPVDGLETMIQAFKTATSNPSTHYLDGILFAKDRGVVCVGRLSDDPADGSPIQHFTRATDPWFYLHAERINKRQRNQPVSEAIPINDYLFRYDRGAFWGGYFAFRYFITPFNRVTRWALDRFMRPRVMYHALHKSGLAMQSIVQDVAVPYENALDLLDYLDHAIGCYPLWLCPISLADHRGPWSLMALSQQQGLNPSKMLLNFGVWCSASPNREKFVKLNRDIEHKVQELNGLKCLYAHAYYTEDEFWSIYDRKLYDKLRSIYHADHLPSIYDKVTVNFAAEQRALAESWAIWIKSLFWRIWPLRGVYGVLHVILGHGYMLQRGNQRRDT
ncbi:FAD binding domain-containing protein [Coccidioides immitis RS]|uniref:Delta(24)-sterol reductase n=3 Tax=Coccidioides immitis TaxID=5501 RepID=J3KK72_COCIM|nr:FAD binding domain-containing protein [Coccidioides immitis RS]EAS36549.3 FAD binding domain-containing protein [Coccidioides immitis RS]KMP01911.1 24-dehydrocholesterol reductase [Coccidioides immitis RMSCC 2394]KMU90322.1 24-dehydrocholesterol reductase [Coccidioides immitis H538.4]TPX25341.1 hypothetical protein DIZ76_010793 [Coccidioides immitis]